jgi:chromosome segregation protein
VKYLLLKSLEIQGFKSFPDKTLLTFGTGITAVVGPNGSGKSNISDAIRWVLGEQSTKTLRGGHMEDVIFGGTVSRKAQGFAEVSLTIENTLHRLNIDGDDVTVTRRLYRSGESEYLLNSKDVRLKDIHQLFMDTGLGRDGYSMIGQGKIAEIVGAKSEDRREIFEEAAGIAKFRYKKEESERRLSTTEENLMRLYDILSELEGRLAPLKEQSDKAKQYIEHASEKKTLEVGLWLYSLEKQRDLLRENENKLLLIKTQYDETEQKIEDIEKAIEDAYFAAQKKSVEIDEIRKQASILDESAVKKQSAAEILKNDIEHNNENINRINCEILNAHSTQGEAEKELEDRTLQSEQKTTSLITLKERLEIYNSEILELAGRSEHFSDKLEAATQQMSKLNMSASHLAVEKQSLITTLEYTKERINAIDIEVATRQERAEQANEQLEEKSTKLIECNENISGLVNSLKGYELKLYNRRQKLYEADQQERTISLAVSEKTQRAAMLTDLEKHLEGFAHSVKMVMKEKERGGLRGIHGPVSRLIKVPQEYSVAVETALGGSLQHIVTDNEENAKAAITLLKHSDSGRATFLPINTISGSLADSNLAGCDGYIGIASKLISYEPIYNGIVTNLLGRTIIAQDLDSAVIIAKKSNYRLRVVTLDGQIVNAGGSLTGGSYNKNIGLLSRASEIEKLNEAATVLKNQLESIQTIKKSISAEVSSLQASVLGLRGEATSAGEEKIRIEGEIKRLEEIISSASNDISALQNEKASSDEKITLSEQALSIAIQKISQTEEDIAKSKVEIEALGGGKDDLVELREQKLQELTSLRLDIMSFEKDIETINQSILHLKQTNIGHFEKIEALEQQITQHEQRIETAQLNIQALFDEAEKLRIQATQTKQQCEAIAEQRTASEQHVTQLRADERALGGDKEKISKEMARLEERKSTSQIEYDAVIARLWDEYELTRSEAEKIASEIVDATKAQRRLSELKNIIKDLGSVNVGAIDEYIEVYSRFEFLSTQIADVEKARNDLNALIYDLTAKMREIFSEQFEIINKHFSETFSELFNGGNANLRLTEPEDVLNSGIEINVQPPGKIIKSLSMLSGGEQAFIAIALYFAILKVRPSPFCVLDEIEAALDENNVVRFATYLRRMCDNTQFIVITHRRGTMDEADVLYGVTMQDEGVSKLLTLNVSELVKKLGIG